MRDVVNSLTILHLSDLHIISHVNSYSTVLHRMIDSVHGLTKKDKNIIITVTGDIVEKGQFEKHSDALLSFFNDLFVKFQKKIIDILFVPGNHDKTRGILDLKNTDAYNEDSFWDNFKKKDWQYFEDQFEDYNNFVYTIRETGLGLEHAFSGTYGVHTVSVGDNKVCFICINSAWSCMGDNDKGNLRIGRFQLNDLQSEYGKVSKDVDLTIALMHHPSDWLTPIEVDYLNQFLTDEYRLNTNIVLQGHIHEKNIYNWYNQSHSLVTLVTGMGWDQQHKLNEGGHRFSIYRINFDSNIVKVKTYVTDQTGEFIEDTNFYNGQDVCFPLYIHKYLEQNELAFNGNEIPVYYPSRNIFNDLSMLNERLVCFIYSMYDVIESYSQEYKRLLHFRFAIYDIINHILDDSKETYFSCEKTKIVEIIKSHDIYIRDERRFDFVLSGNSVDYQLDNVISEFINYVSSNKGEQKQLDINEYRKILNNHRDNKNRTFKKDTFLSFLSELLTRLQKEIFISEKFTDGDTVRFHFRKSDYGLEPIYEKLSTLKAVFNCNQRWQITTDTDLTDIAYSGSLIERSFSAQQSLLYSLNPSSNNLIKKDDWIDFLTIAINSDYNKYTKKEGVRRSEFPCLSFGITVDNIVAQDIIRNLSYIKFEKILDMLFLKFFETIQCNVDVLIKG